MFDNVNVLHFTIIIDHILFYTYFIFIKFPYFLYHLFLLIFLFNTIIYLFDFRNFILILFYLFRNLHCFDLLKQIINLLIIYF